jgi:hypothetical protein
MNMGTVRAHRWLALLAIVVMVAAMMAGPAAATPKNAAGEHKATICQVTNSATNPYVIIEVDRAAFDVAGKSDHAHHIAKDGRGDLLYNQQTGECEAQPGDDPGGQPTNF